MSQNLIILTIKYVSIFFQFSFHGRLQGNINLLNNFVLVRLFRKVFLHLGVVFDCEHIAFKLKPPDNENQEWPQLCWASVYLSPSRDLQAPGKLWATTWLLLIKVWQMSPSIYLCRYILLCPSLYPWYFRVASTTNGKYILIQLFSHYWNE